MELGSCGPSKETCVARQSEIKGILMDILNNSIERAQAKWKIVCNSDICAGCRICEVVCSLYKEGVVTPELSRIQVVKSPLDGYISEAKICKQCPDPECLAVCPTQALYIDGVTGARVIDEKNCTGCKLCIEACISTPKRIRYNSEKKVCIKCDLCAGNPQCVRFCPQGALQYIKS